MLKNPWVALSKPRLTALSVLSAIIGYVLGWRHEHALFDETFFWTLLGVCLLGAGANALNMLMEREYDALMDRTKNRPLPAKTLSFQQVLAYGVVAVTCGTYILSAYVNANAGWLGLLTLATYILVYTPLKRKTTFNTFFGAIPGALPPLIGYAASRGGLDGESVYLAMIIFFWQMPHFFALSWIYREDYRKAGYSMLCVVDDDKGTMTSRQINLFVFYLIPISLAPTFFQFTHMIYFVGASILGAGFLACTVWLFKGLTDKSARRVFRYSNIYLTFLMLLMVFDVHYDYLNALLDNYLQGFLLPA